MTAHFAKDSFELVLPKLSREEKPGFAARLTGAVQWLAEMPRRRALLNELSVLSDHELQDIGLTRGDLPRVFDPGFGRQRSFARTAGN
jgi:uncharacterized protein YjiS (DUF1127 family)